MPGRGPTTFQKRQKEQARKEKREEKLARRHQKKNSAASGASDNDNDTQLDDLGIERGPAETDEPGPVGQESPSHD
jgi:hypothetical protein